MKKLLFLFFLLLGVSSCGIKTNNDAAFPLDKEEVGSEIFNPTSTTLAGSALGDESTINLFFIDKNEKLVPIARELSEPTIGNALDALTAAPLADEVDTYGLLFTRLPLRLNPTVKKVDRDTSEIVIEVSDEAGLNDLARSDSEVTLILGQIVCTVDGFLADGKPIKGVTIQDGQGPIRALDSNLNPIEGPATIADFNNCKIG